MNTGGGGALPWEPHGSESGNNNLNRYSDRILEETI